MGNPIVHWEIGGEDRKKLQDFYGSLFDWNIDSMDAMNYGMVKTGAEPGGGISALQADDQQPRIEFYRKPYVTFYVAVDDLQASLDKAVALGGKMVVPVTPIPNIGEFAMFSDPAGNVIGIFKG